MKFAFCWGIERCRPQATRIVKPAQGYKSNFSRKDAKAQSMTTSEALTLPLCLCVPFVWLSSVLHTGLGVFL